ncbi:hypothetical protein OKA05_24425 [Luteolibacter arcticus]|uniref:Uncharacterized protein n=1 Tax=Luteolibacter arcticus TaxID=1581411 RepID=A0ABT3GQB5_9BACT|nr:hypothetical protein [Luteolibacter arcticus]MCW1925726.1 hypothetical protein [Luteolibacter arcticus]
MSTTIRFDPQGGIDCLYTEVVDLRALGRLRVVRATEITFDPEEQRWEISPAAAASMRPGRACSGRLASRGVFKNM